MRSTWLAWLAMASAAAAGPIVTAAPTFNPLETFAPFRYPDPVSRYRTADGLPSPDYWQNRADYELQATLDPQQKTLAATEVITYTNNSPSPLTFLWLQLDQNRYRQDARAELPSGGARGHTDGYQIASVEAAPGPGGAFAPATNTISDTRMRVELAQPVAAHGGKVRLRIAYRYEIPAGSFGGRTDWTSTANGDIFEIAQWYPRLCVYDDLRGWDTLPFLNSEFYLEYGDFDYRVTLPSDMIVVGSGELVKPAEVLTRTEQSRLAQARQSEKTVLIRTPDDVTDASRRSNEKTLTWHFRMQNTRDVAFGASRAFVWDAARIDLPSGRSALAMSAYPIESLQGDGWRRSTEYVKHTVEFFSQRWLEYPYPSAINEAGVAGGMEYPGIVFDSLRSKGQRLFSLTTHEIGHGWFPMIVGSNERRAAWMDEGFSTFAGAYAEPDFNKREYGVKHDSEYAPGGGNPAEEIVKTLKDPDAPPILTAADQISEKYRHPVSYFKAAFGLVLLREQILGPARFDAAFRQYVQAWAYKHPSPSDFFRAMESAAGEDLSWFWRGWFEQNWTFDLAVRKVAYVDDDPAKGALVTVANLEKLVLPATLEIVYSDGTNARINLPVETWQRAREVLVKVPGAKALRSATIDPGRVLPDADRSNNTVAVEAAGR